MDKAAIAQTAPNQNTARQQSLISAERLDVGSEKGHTHGRNSGNINEITTAPSTTPKTSWTRRGKGEAAWTIQGLLGCLLAAAAALHWKAEASNSMTLVGDTLGCGTVGNDVS